VDIFGGEHMAFVPVCPLSPFLVGQNNQYFYRDVHFVFINSVFVCAIA